MSKKEMMNIIYDTLMGNVDSEHPQLNLDEVIEPEIDNDDNVITFGYKGSSFKLEIERI